MADDSSTLLPQNPNLSSNNPPITENNQEIIDPHLCLAHKLMNENQEPLKPNPPTSMDPETQPQEPASDGETDLVSLHDSHTPVENPPIGNSRSPEKNEPEGRRAKRVRKRGKGPKKHPNANGDLDQDFERQCVCDCDKRGGGARVVYGRGEMEGLRWVDVDEQRKKWVEVYCGLGPVVAGEYDGLVGSGYRGEVGSVSFDPRKQFAAKTALRGGVSGKETENPGGETENTKHMDPDVDECSDDYDSDEEYVSIQKPAFLVTGEPDFDSGPPQDGLEYLRRVRWEAERIPNVTVAEVESEKLNKEQTVYMPKIPEIAACPEHLMPSKEWEDVFLSDFSDLRLALSQEQSSSTPIFSIELPQNFQENLENPTTEKPEFSASDADETTTTDTPEPASTAAADWPALHTVMGMEPVARVSALRRRVKALEPSDAVSRADAAWLFALFAAVDTPLDADTTAAVRCLLRKCAGLRAAKAELDDEAVMLNVLATIAGRFFGQSGNLGF